MSAGLISSEASLLGLQMGIFCLCVHVVDSLCELVFGVTACVLTASNKDTSHTELEPSLMILF